MKKFEKFSKIGNQNEIRWNLYMRVTNKRTTGKEKMTVDGGRNVQTEQLKQAVEQMKQGEEKGFNYIYGETYNFVSSRAKIAINDEQEVQDLVQEVYVAVYRNIESLKNVESLYAWLATIIMRQGAKMANKKKNHVLLSEENHGMFEELPDESVKLESDAIRKEDAIIIRGLLERLPAEQKSAVVSFYYDGLKVEQIADATKTSAGTIKKRLYLARKRLQEYIAELERKEGVRLRGFGAPVLILAVKMLLEENTLSAVSAQGIYNQVCSEVGIKASALAFQSVEAGTTTMAGTDTTEGLGKGIKTGLTGQMKGQGTGMNKLVNKIAALGKVKIAAIATGVVAVAGAGTATGVYLHHQSVVKEAQAEEKQQKEEQAKAEQKEKEALLADLTKRYEKAEELRDNLILEDAVVETVNKGFTKVKNALDNKKVDKDTEEIMTVLEESLEDYRKQNEQYLNDKKAAMYDYHTELFTQEKQTELDNMLSEYETLFMAIKYKDADKKLDQMNSTMVAYMNENYPEEVVASNSGNETDENGSGSTGKNGNGNHTGNTGNSGNTGNGGNTGSTGGNSSSGSTGNSSNGNAQNTTQTNTSTEQTSTARWADGRCIEVENEIIANTACEDGIGLSSFSGQFESIAASYVAGSISAGEAEQQIADIVLNNTDMPVINVKATSWTVKGSTYQVQGLGCWNWCYVRAYYNVATDTLTIYVVDL